MRPIQATTLPAVDRFIEDNGSRMFKTGAEDKPCCTRLELIPDIQSAAPDDEAAWEMEA